MTPHDLLTQCDHAEAHGGTLITLKVKRKPGKDAKSLQIAPGLRCQLVQWGDGTWAFPSVVMCEIADVRTSVEKALGEAP